MKVTLTNNLYNGYTKTKNNKKNKNMTNGITFGGPQKKFHKKDKKAAGELAQDIQATASKAISNINKTLIKKGKEAAGNLLENVNLSKASNCIQFKDKDNNTIILTNPQYYDNNIIKSCDKQTIINKNGLTEDTYENPQYFRNGRMKSCDKRCTIETTLSGNKITGITKTTYENPQFDNGKMTSCKAKTISTTKYNNKEQIVSKVKTTNENLQFDNGRVKSCGKICIIEKKLSDGKITGNIETTYENSQMANGRVKSCGKRFTIEKTFNGDTTGIIETTYENPQCYANGIIQSCDKQTIINKNGLTETTYENPQYFENGLIKSCGKQTIINKNGLTETTYENPQYFENGKMKSYDKKYIIEKTLNGDKTTGNIEITCENLKHYDNGKMKSCGKQTIINKNGLTETTYENPQYFENGRMKSCGKTFTIKKTLNGDTTSIIETTYENLQYSVLGKIQSCDKAFIIENTLSEGEITGITKTTYENSQYDDNGRIKSCDKRTKKRINYIDGKITGISEYTEENLQFYANGRKKSCDKAYLLEKKLSEDGTVEVPQVEIKDTKLKYLEDGRIASIEEDETKLFLTGEKIIHYNYQNIDKESNIYHAEQIYKINEKSNKYTYAFDVTLKDDIILPELCVKYDPSNDSFKYMYKHTFKKDQHNTLTTSAKESEFEMILTADGECYLQNRDDLVNKKPAIAQNAEAWQSLSPDEQEKYLAQIKMVYIMLINIHNFGTPYVEEERSAKSFIN